MKSLSRIFRIIALSAVIWIYPLASVLFSLACANKTNRSDSITNYALDDTATDKKAPPVHKLPFGPPIRTAANLCDVPLNFYYSLIGTNLEDNPQLTKSYQLPEIRSLKYLVIDTSKEGNICSGNLSVDSLFRPETYKCRLPDIGAFHVFYISNIRNGSTDYSQRFTQACDDFVYDYYGYLGLYSKSSKEITVIPIFYERYRDSEHIRCFYIDSKYKIFICNETYSEGENGADKAIDSQYEIVIQDNGNVVINKIK